MTEQTARKWLIRLLLTEGCFAGIYIFSSLLDTQSSLIHALFDLDGEGNIPALFSSMQLLLIGFFFLRAAQKPVPLASRPVRVLFIAGAISIFLAFDEGLAIHEKIGFMLRDYRWIPRFKEKYGVWISPYTVIGFLMTLLAGRDLVPLWRHYRREVQLMLWGGMLFVFGAVGMEMIKY